ncbi:hypothetical protein [Micromonospora carbonacea]|uniref:Uncharacterized protein n=1 Tax=Micromonospora carbonacea TaxID=47853 RepID=A0A1C5AAC6_9ACTN|nr:hypothetical protein [Micromonospora carbonacea]SCF42192.1 hypothetical protein GA0070563_11249 [Micromonospora carbonacea]
MRRFRYFISYAFTTRSGHSGHGSTELQRDMPIQGYADVQKIAAELAEMDRLEKVIILNFQLFPQPVGTEHPTANR